MVLERVVINGKYLSARPTGVHRVASELIQQIDLEFQTGNGARSPLSWELVVPRDAKIALPLKTIPCRQRGLMTWQPWEQFELPVIARGTLLLSLCNLAPLSLPGGITMIHDAQVYISPQSYSRAFRNWYRFALPKIGAMADRILTVSAFSRDRLVEFGIAPLSKIEVIHNGVDHIYKVVPDRTILERLTLRPGRYAVALANTQRHKNIGILLRAFARPELAKVTLVLVGREDEAAFAAANLRVPSNVIFSGPVDDAALRGLMEQAACLAFPSLTEGFGLPPLEAMAVGCPAIVAPRGALPEACGDAAIYADPDDDAAWAEAILRFVEDPEAKAVSREKGHVRAALFTWANSAKALLRIVREVALARS